MALLLNAGDTVSRSYSYTQPSPLHPSQPQGTGERTWNLFDENYPNISVTIRYIPLYVGEGSFTLSTTTPYDSGVANVFLLSGNVSTEASTIRNGAWLKHNVTTQSVDGYVTIAYRHYAGTTSPANCQTMLNAGSTALPYEPYGYKIPISSANTTTPVYLGEVETTRKNKKYEFTGTESISSNTLGVSKVGFTIAISDMLSNGRKNGYCTHFVAQNSPSGSSLDGITYGVSDKVLYVTFSVATATAYNLTDVTSVKTWLSQQYANGTPVTVWYVLATEETGIVNEPIRKIGDYADTLSMEQAGVSIPTNNGSTTVDVETTLKPSEVYIKYKGV